MCTVHFGFLLSAALQCTPKVSLHYSATMCIAANMLHNSHCSTTRFSAKMLFSTTTVCVAPLRTTASTNHSAP